MNTRLHLLGAITLAGIAGGAFAQTSTPEVEPNGSKGEATPTPGLIAGDSVTGTTTGTSVTVGNTALTSADTFRIKTAAAPLAIYRHTMTITTTGTAGHTGTFRGLNQATGVITPGTDATLQTSLTTPARTNSWYGFGKQEELNYRVVGTATTTAAYVSTLSTTTVTPIAVAGAFNPGNITVSTFGQGHTSDTEIYVYDGNLNPVPLGHNDSPNALDATLSTVTVPLAAGTYFVAVSIYNTSNNQSDLNPGEQWSSDPVLDFPNAMTSNSTATNVNVGFSVSDGTTTTNQAATKVAAFDVVWSTFTVGTPGSPTVPYCFGNGTGTACPCGNSGAAGNGCANSLNANGANIAGSGTASIAADTFKLTGTGMPNASALYFQGTAQVAGGAGAVFGDGLRCAGGSIARLKTVTNVGGTSMYPGVGDVPISIRGNNVAGNVRHYQVWYRNADVAFCPPATFNLSNGLTVTWTP